MHLRVYNFYNARYSIKVEAKKNANPLFYVRYPKLYLQSTLEQAHLKLLQINLKLI